MFTEDELLPISALQHLLFCERQCALIHLEQAWAENRLTAEGRVLHERVHEADTESRGDVRVVRALRLRSLALGLYGVADVVELHRAEDSVAIKGLRGTWKPMPIEYKRGKPKENLCDEVQLCAQGMCLEEQLACSIDGGALFYGTPRRRTTVAFDSVLREATTRAAAKLHELIGSGRTPPPEPGPKCKQCSLRGICLPESMGRSAQRYLAVAVQP